MNTKEINELEKKVSKLKKNYTETNIKYLKEREELEKDILNNRMDSLVNRCFHLFHSDAVKKESTRSLFHIIGIDKSLNDDGNPFANFYIARIIKQTTIPNRMDLVNESTTSIGRLPLNQQYILNLTLKQLEKDDWKNVIPELKDYQDITLESFNKVFEIITSNELNIINKKDIKELKKSKNVVK